VSSLSPYHMNEKYIVEKLVIGASALYGLRNPLHFLSGNYASVSKIAPNSHFPVVGHLPSFLDREFVHVGPDLKFEPGDGFQWLDGDGMIHGLRINGKATYVSHYVKTSCLKQHEYFGKVKFFKIGDIVPIINL
jgi:carotenoid cleavage dioxygenase-like enzyme